MSTLEQPFAGVPQPLRAAIERRGYTAPTPVQQAVLAAKTAGRSLRISSQTGSGKTLALGFALADSFVEDDGTHARSSANGPTALIITPTRELAAQVRDELRWLFEDVRGLEIGVVTGGTDVGRERRLLSRGPGIVVGTPGRLLDHIRNGALKCADIEQVVLDEADHMLDMGFRDELDAILDELPQERRSHLVSATFPDHVRRLADKFQDDPVHLQGSALGAANADIEHVAHLVTSADKYAALVNHLLLTIGERVLIFVDRRDEATHLAARLADDGFAAQPFSGELSQPQRTRALDAFRQGTLNILVSTDVAARGIDVPDIALVVHGGMPSDPACYTHRSGRTGRAGAKGTSLLLVDGRQRRHLERMLSRAKIAVKWQPIPTPKDVRKAFTKRTRRALHAHLDEVATVPTESEQAEYATRLLEGRDPVAVVTALLEMVKPKLPREPMEVAAPARPRDANQRVGQHAGGFVRYSVNWGARTGATPGRLLSHLCRRGEVTSRQIGGIDVGADASTFELSADAAAAFEALVQRPDPRDPHVEISRSGPVHVDRERPRRRPTKAGDDSRGRRSWRAKERGGYDARRGHDGPRSG